MDELQLLRERLESQPGPAPHVIAQARGRLLDLATPPRRRARYGLRRPGWRAATAGALVVALAGGLTVAGVTGSGQHGHGAGILRAAPANAAELARQAAAATASRPDPDPRPDQWEYFRTRLAKVPTGAAGWSGVLPPRVTQESWRRVDGKWFAELRGGWLVRWRQQMVVWPPLDDTFLRGLPTDPDLLLARIYHEVGRLEPWMYGGTADGRKQQTFAMVANLLGDHVLPRRLDAALYLALAKIPGVVLVPDAVDAAGRHGVAFARVQDDWLKTEIILDPHTYVYLGWRLVTVRDHVVPGSEDGPSLRVSGGTVLEWSARLAAAIVDQPGQRR